jgi:hypothetical protein
MTMRQILSWGYSGGGWGTANQGIGFLQPDLVSQCAGRDVLSSRRKEFRPTWLQYSQDSINQVSNKSRWHIDNNFWKENSEIALSECQVPSKKRKEEHHNSKYPRAQSHDTGQLMGET